MMVTPREQAMALFYRTQNPFEFCDICHKKIGVCKHTKKNRRIYLF